VEIGGQGVVVVADRRLAGSAESAAVGGGDTGPGGEQGPLLLLPEMPLQQGSVNEHRRLTLTLILVVDFDVGGVFRSADDSCHAFLLFDCPAPCSVRSSGRWIVGVEFRCWAALRCSLAVTSLCALRWHPDGAGSVW